MRTSKPVRAREEGGQALVLLALGLAVLLSMSALIVDGGNAMAQQRATQNGADAASLSAATVLVESMGGASRDDDDVLAAIQQSLTLNESDLDDATMTRIRAITARVERLAVRLEPFALVVDF